MSKSSAKEKITFSLKTEFIQLNQLLKATNVCMSGGEAGELIASGSVFLNKKNEKRKRAKLFPGDVVNVGDFEILIKEKIN
ncbi:MAG: RNA-binding S4 domain-containing protein [Chitinophagaceae bacterium]|nr:MAG: RNA-binding S4 domain-containing protein [Chitinophagaceae bacterium]